jgi:hypothetical protein
MQGINKLGFRRYIATLFLVTVLVTVPIKDASALDYTRCLQPKDSSACYIAYQKLISMKNPITKKTYFDDGYHSPNGYIEVFPFFNVAEADLDGDGFTEVIAALSEDRDLTEGLFCKNDFDCPHYIFQDRNIDPKNLSMKNIKVFGPIFSYGIGLSTDEIIDGFRSLRSYRDYEYKEFDVYQYDKKTDEYYNVSAPE